MEADWSVEVGPGTPCIEVPWSGEGLQWVDLRNAATSLSEACGHAVASLSLEQAQPALAAALEQLNGPHSAWFSSKCDAWQMNPECDVDFEPLDPYEFEAEDLAHSPEPLVGFASYLDLILIDRDEQRDLARVEAQARALVASLRNVPCAQARVDLVLRPALVNGLEGFACTAYVIGCGLNAEKAAARWEQALHLCVETLLKR